LCDQVTVPVTRLIHFGKISERFVRGTRVRNPVELLAVQAASQSSLAIRAIERADAEGSSRAQQGARVFIAVVASSGAAARSTAILARLAVLSDRLAPSTSASYP
jgi:hypothetical protein